MTLTRRRLLSALAAAGGAGALSSRETRARLSDREAFESFLASGMVDLAVQYEIVSGPGAGDPATRQGTIDGPQIHIPTGTLGTATPSGSMLVTFELPTGGPVPNNPASLWLATECPTPSATHLADAIRLTISTADCATGAPIQRIAQGTLREVGEAMQTGHQIDGDPTTGGMDCLTDATCVLVEYELVGYVGSETVDLPLWFGAVQCRHDPQVNPFADREVQPCAPGDPCPCCTTIGKLEFDEGEPGLGDSYATPGTYPFTEGDTSYGLEIYETRDKPDEQETVGVAFRLVDVADPDAIVPEICSVLVKGGNGHTEYVDETGAGDDTAGLPGSDADGVVYAPDGHGISHVTVCVCTWESPEDCDGCTDPSISGPDQPGPPEKKPDQPGPPGNKPETDGPSPDDPDQPGPPSADSGRPADTPGGGQ